MDAAQSSSLPPPPDEPALAAPAGPSARARWRAGALIHSGVSVRGFYVMHALGAAVPLAAGVALYGWRAAACVGLVLAGAMLGLAAWRRIGGRGRQLQPSQALWMALLLGLMLPAHLASNVPDPSPGHGFAEPLWPIAIAGGFVVVVLLWLAGGVGNGRFHPALYAYILLFACFGETLTPFHVLAKKHLVGGDVLRAAPVDPVPAADGNAKASAGRDPLSPDPEPWVDRLPTVGNDALWVQPASLWLTLYTRGQLPLARGRMPLHELLRERMPPLEDLVVAGQPAGVGCAGAVSVIVGGLFLLYRGLIDFRIPLLVVLSAYAALFVLPVPTVITESGAHFRWLIPREPDVMWETAVTFANYELTASPALFAAFFLATAPNVRPLGRRARIVYAVLVGVATAAAQLYVSVAIGPYIALAAVGLIAPWIDRWFRPRTLV